MYHLNYNKLSKNLRFQRDVINQHAEMLNKIRETNKLNVKMNDLSDTFYYMSQGVPVDNLKKSQQYV